MLHYFIGALKILQTEKVEMLWGLLPAPPTKATARLFLLQSAGDFVPF